MSKLMAARSPPDDFAALIAEAAYYKAEQRGFEPGSELADWLEAESEVKAALKAKPKPKRAKKAAIKTMKSAANGKKKRK